MYVDFFLFHKQLHPHPSHINNNTLTLHRFILNTPISNNTKWVISTFINKHQHKIHQHKIHQRYFYWLIGGELMNLIFVHWHFISFIIVINPILSEFGKNPQIVSFLGNHCSLRRADGSLISTAWVILKHRQNKIPI